MPSGNMRMSKTRGISLGRADNMRLSNTVFGGNQTNTVVDFNKETELGTFSRLPADSPLDSNFLPQIFTGNDDASSSKDDFKF